MKKVNFLFRLKFILLTFLFSNFLNAQYTNLPLGYNFNLNLGVEIDQNIQNTSFKPIIIGSQNIDFESVLEQNFFTNNSILDYRIFNKHLIEISGEDYYVGGSLLSNLSVGYEDQESLNAFVNTRGFIIDGFIGDRVSFQTTFLENQAIFPNYIDSLIRTQDYVIPGQGRGRTYYNNGFDYARSSGFVSIEASRNFTVQFGHGKHFIGDGYRSLLLSDNSFNYPFLRLQSSFGKFQYTNLYCEFQDMKNYLSFENNYDYMGYAKKYMSAHYLSYNLNEKLSIGLYESIVWKTNRTLGSNGFDINYLNPVIFFRPVEFSVNSPDNALIGLNVKYKLTHKSNLYGQIVFDEFTLNEMRENSGYWANKYGYQIGYKCYDFLSLPNLTLHVERNNVRPYTYSHWNDANYGHYNEELAHPLGANFSENILILSYRKKRITAQFKYLDITYGSDYLGDSISYGSDIYADYNNRSSDFGIDMYNGNKTEVDFMKFNLGYVLNPTTNLKLEFSLTHRNQTSESYDQTTNYYSFSLISDLFNYYYDF